MPDSWESPLALLAAPAGIALVVAAVGPMIYARAARRGRGALAEVKKNSRGDRGL
ncbi:MAG: hypothetical protein HYV27_07935 [Candidatus Hydrogenedentes bacterium]|nr:hypothetical protein [Candidatus Hydrogenedentota bacterium]